MFKNRFLGVNIISIPAFVGSAGHPSRTSSFKCSFKGINSCSGKLHRKDTEANEDRLLKCGKAREVVIV